MFTLRWKLGNIILNHDMNDLNQFYYFQYMLWTWKLMFLLKVLNCNNESVLGEIKTAAMKGYQKV